MAYLLVLLLLLCSASSRSSEEKEIQLLVLAPYPQPQLDSYYQPSISDGPALHLAAELAAEIAMNASGSILQGYHLSLQPGDSGCSIPFRAIEAFTTPLISSIQGSGSAGKEKEAPIVGVIGPACSLSAIHVSSLTGHSEVALINIHLTGTFRLNDRASFPYSFGILDSAELIALTMTSLIKQANWSKVAIFYDSSREYHSSVVRQFSELNPENSNYNQVPLSSSNLAPFLAIENTYRIVFLIVDLDMLSQLMCMALHYGFSHPAYQFILVVEDAEMIGPATISFNGQSKSCTSNQTRAMLNASISIIFQLERPDSDFVTSSGITLSEFKDKYKERVQESNRKSNITIEETIYAVNFFDAVWAFILALNNSADAVDLSNYSFGQPNVTNHIKEELLKLNFEGLSGKIQFDRTTGRIRQNESLFLVNEVGTTKFGFYSRETNNITNTTGEDVLFISDEFETVILTVPKGLISLALVMTFTGFLIALILNIFTCKHRNSQSVKASSVKIIQLAYIGCYIQILSLVSVILVFGFSDVLDEKLICKVQDLLDFTLSIGLSVLFGSICVRIWRLYRIFNHFKNPGKLLSDYFLAAIIFLIVCVDLIFTLPAFFVDGYTPSSDEVPSRDPPTIFTVNLCKRKKFFLWSCLDLLVPLVLLVTISILGILTRKIPIKNFKTRSIIYMSYTLTVVIPLTMGIYFLLVSVKERSYVYLILQFCTLCELCLSLIVIPCLMLFFPPLLPLLRRRLPRVCLPHLISTLHFSSRGGEGTNCETPRSSPST